MIKAQRYDAPNRENQQCGRNAAGRSMQTRHWMLAVMFPDCLPKGLYVIGKDGLAYLDVFPAAQRRYFIANLFTKFVNWGDSPIKIA